MRTEDLRTKPEEAALPSAAGRLGRGLFVVFLLVVAAITAIVHGPTLSSQAIGFDDEQFYLENPLVRQPSWHSFTTFFAEIFTPSTVRGYATPLTMTSLMLDSAAGGRADDLHAFHRTNLALHALNAMLVAMLFALLGIRPLFALLGGLLFGLHPLTVEPVAWVAERKTLLATFFALLALIAYARRAAGDRARAGGGASRDFPAHARAWWIAAFVFYLLAILAKPTAIVLPALFLLLDLWPFHRPLTRSHGARIAEAWREKIPFFALAALWGAITLISHARTADVAWDAGQGGAGASLGPARLHFFYLAKFFWPARLSALYSFSHPAPLGNVLAIFGLVLLVAALALLWRRARAPMAAWLFFAIAIAPTLGILRFSWVEASDKYMYLPMVGLLLGVAWALDAGERARARMRQISPRTRPAISPRTRTALFVVLALVVCGLSARATRAHLVHWKDTLTLHRFMAERAPDSAEVQTNLGVALSERGEAGEAAQHFRRAIELDPRHLRAYNNLGCLLAEKGEQEEAIALFRRAVEIDPQYAEAHFNLGRALLERRDFAGAAAALRQASAARPRYAQAHHLLARALQGTGELQAAIESERQAAAFDPSWVEAKESLAMLLVAAGRFEEARVMLGEVIRTRPANPRTLAALAWVLATGPSPEPGDAEQAVRLAERAISLPGGEAFSYLDALAAAYAANGRYEEARNAIRRAIASAEAAGASASARAMAERGALYERGLPFRSAAVH
ncbi:MAG: tetratricopeptide repeat protein [Candidatus Eisenbacteria bacterium]|nr:tetratricopeptide repeat protein [Candidatus Eisenbacteria bacterium]